MTSCEVEASSVLKEITVYENRAQVHRQANVAIAEGETRLVFPDLPTSVDVDSLQVSFLPSPGTEHIVLRGIQFDTQTIVNKEFEAQQSERSQASSRVEVLKKELRGLKDDLDHLRKYQQLNGVMLQRATSVDVGVGPEIFDPSTWDALLDTYVGATETQLREQRRLENAIEVVSKNLQLAQSIQREHIPATISRRVVAVIVTSRTEVPSCTLVLSYLVDSASWSPEYEIRVNSETLEVKIGYNAVITQTTSEDWKDVRMELSTARPTLSGKQPELQPWRIDVVRMVPKPSRSMMAKSCAMSNDGEESLCRLELQCDRINDAIEYLAPQVETAAVTEAATSVSFAVPRNITVMCDGEATRASLLSLDFVAKMHHTTVPSLQEKAFASAKFKNTSDIPLSAGPTAIFLDGQFVTASSIERTNPGEELEIDVGIDEGLAVKRKLINRKRIDEGGMFTSKKDVVKFKYLTTVKNTKKVEVSLKLKERIPVSDCEDLVVNLTEPSSVHGEEAKKLLKEEGIVQVEQQLAPGETIEFPFHFNVTSPEGRTVFGL